MLPLFDMRFVPTPGGLEHGERGVPAIRFLDDEARDLTMPARTWLRLASPPNPVGTDRELYYEWDGAVYGRTGGCTRRSIGFGTRMMWFESIESGPLGAREASVDVRASVSGPSHTPSGGDG